MLSLGLARGGLAEITDRQKGGGSLITESSLPQSPSPERHPVLSVCPRVSGLSDLHRVSLAPWLAHTSVTCPFITAPHLHSLK